MKLKVTFLVKYSPAKETTGSYSSVQVSKSGSVIGRIKADLILPDNLVSRRHARLYQDEHGFLRMKDCGSQNGVYHNGKRIKDTSIKKGDILRIGHTELVVQDISIDGIVLHGWPHQNLCNPA